MEFNKLVRDKIPQMIESQGEKPVIRILGEEEYHAALEQKFLEEAGEYRESRELAELADILEVVFALCEADGHTLEELDTACRKKHEARGGFAERVFLVSKST